MANQNTPKKETKSKIIKRLLAEGLSVEDISEQVNCPETYVKLVIKRVNEKDSNSSSKKEQKEKAKAELAQFVKTTQDLASLKNLALQIIENTKDLGLLVKIHNMSVLED